MLDLIHATSLSEKENLIQFGLPAKIFIVEEGYSCHLNKNSLILPSEQDLSEARTLLFLARLHPVKGLELLRVFPLSDQEGGNADCRDGTSLPMYWSFRDLLSDMG